MLARFQDGRANDMVLLVPNMRYQARKKLLAERRYAEIRRMVAEGLSDVAICKRLCISLGVVKRALNPPIRT
jgi:DNA-binding NarL/FixJ family response regulator